MSHARVLGIVGLTAIAAAAVAFAQTTVTPIPEEPPVETAPLAETNAVTTWGDAQNGATLAGTCAACHGLDGNPTDPMYPRIAGQSERYIAQQMALFRSGERNTGMAAIMKPFADMLSPQDSRDVGAYYATQTAGAGVADDTLVTSGPYEGLEFYEIGQQLFRSGDAERGIPACMACHGPSGSGNPGPAYPHVGGQFAAYSQARLEVYRAGDARDDRMFEIMAAVASELTDEEIGALASYMEGLHPASRDAAIGEAVVAAAAPAPAAAPAASEEAPAATDATVEEGATEAADAADAGAEPAAAGEEAVDTSEQPAAEPEQD